MVESPPPLPEDGCAVSINLAQRGVWPLSGSWEVTSKLLECSVL